jgi:hypothetical protein
MSERRSEGRSERRSEGRSEGRSERRPREVPPEKGEQLYFKKQGYRTAQERADHESALYHERGLNTDWKNMEYRIETGEYPPATGKLTSYESKSKTKAEAETTLLQKNKELQEKYDKAMERNIYYDGRINKHSEEDKKLRTLIAELRAHIAKYCPKKTFKTIRKIKTLGGQKQKNKSKKPKSNKTKKRKYKRSKHKHTKKQN